MKVEDRRSQGGERWADEITPAGLLALAAIVLQCDVPHYTQRICDE